MTMHLLDLCLAIVVMACAAIDYSSRNPDCWPELLGGGYVLAALVGVTL